MTRFIWTGTVTLPDGGQALVLVNLFPDGEGGHTTVEVALRNDPHDTWGPPGNLVYDGADGPLTSNRVIHP